MESKKAKSSYGQCRCCLNEGYHKNIMKEYLYNGNREVYFDIFLECFNVFLSTNDGLSNLICSPCVERLRDAHTFKTMAISAEKQLLDAIDNKDTIFINVPVGHTSEDLNVETKSMNDVMVKEEPADDVNSMDYDDFDDPPDDRPSNDTDDKLEDANDQDLIEGEAELLARFPRKQLKLLPTKISLFSSFPSFARHLDRLKNKIILPQTIKKILEDSDRQAIAYRPRNVYMTERTAHILNISTLLQCSNMAPFKSKSRSGFPCFYCRSVFQNIEDIRLHQAKEHVKINYKKTLSFYGTECLIVYVDVTDLKCSICNESVPNMNTLKQHLTKSHQKTLNLNVTDRMVPFKLTRNNYECQVCGCRYETFGSIERHMNVHYRNYVCESCGTGFVTKYRLKVHVKSMHVEGNHPCEICKKVFKTPQKYKSHVDAVHKMVKRFKCSTCSERFTEYFKRQKHLVEVHGMAPLLYRCNVCDKTFDRRYALSRHMKRYHLDQRDIQCDICPYTCFTNNELKIHMIKHNGERIYECGVCKKSYARKKTLREHMRIHNNDRRFVCMVCGQAFVQKCSLKGHIKTHHVEYNLM